MGAGAADAGGGDAKVVSPVSTWAAIIAVGDAVVGGTASGGVTGGSTVRWMAPPLVPSFFFATAPLVAPRLAALPLPYFFTDIGVSFSAKARPPTRHRSTCAIIPLCGPVSNSQSVLKHRRFIKVCGFTDDD